MKKCVFCSVVKRNEPFHEIIWRDKKHVAFLDAYPVKEAHVLVIPKKHYDYLFDLNKKEYAALFEVARVVALQLKRASGCKRVAVAVEGFSVPHVHVHLIPLNKKLDLEGVNKKQMANRTSKHLAKIGERLRRYLSRPLKP